MNKPETLPTGSRAIQLFVPTRRVPLDAIERPGGTALAVKLLKGLRKLHAEDPSKVFYEMPDDIERDPLCQAAFDLASAGLAHIVAWQDIKTGAAGMAITLYSVALAEDGRSILYNPEGGNFAN
jgi:hypothetical protein